MYVTDHARTGRRLIAAFAGTVLLTLLVPSAHAATTPRPVKIRSGTVTLTIDGAVAALLTSNGITTGAVAPAIASGSPVNAIGLKVIGGSVDARKRTLTAKLGGGVTLSGAAQPGAAPAITVNLTNATLTVKGLVGMLKADAMPLGTGLPLLKFKLATFPKVSKTRKVTLHNVLAPLEPSIATTLQGVIPGLPGPPSPFGSLEIRLAG